MKNILLLISFTVSISQGLFSQIITDRPDQTESSSVVPNGSLQIESGFLVGFEGEQDNYSRQWLLPTTLFRYGVSDAFELRFLSQFETQKSGSTKSEGISDLEIGTKIQLLQDENKNTEIAFLSHLILPTGSSELSSDKYGTINKLSISHSLSEKVGLGYNIGYNYFGIDKGDLTYSIAIGIGVNDKVGVYIEPYGDIVNFEDFILNFDAGFTYLPHENLQFDFSFGTGINQNMNYISLGASWLLLPHD